MSVELEGAGYADGVGEASTQRSGHPDCWNQGLTGHGVLEF